MPVRSGTERWSALWEQAMGEVALIAQAKEVRFELEGDLTQSCAATAR